MCAAWYKHGQANKSMKGKDVLFFSFSKIFELFYYYYYLQINCGLRLFAAKKKDN